MANAKVYGVIALKGGVGKTTLVVNLGSSLARDFQKKVLLIDANFSTPHLGLHLGLVNPKHNLHQVLNNEYPAYEAIYQHPLGFHILPGSLVPLPGDPLVLKEKIDPLRQIYDVILIDSSPSLNDEMYATMMASDELLVVSSPDYPTLSSTLHAVTVARKKNAPIRGIILNKVRKKKFELTAREISKAANIEVLASLPDDVKVLAALAEMTPVVEHTPNHEVSQLYKKLAASLIDETYRPPRMFKRARQSLSKIGKMLSKPEAGEPHEIA